MTTFPGIFQSLLEHIPADLPVYAVGGMLRDMLLGRAVHDIDFALPSGARRLARRLADALGGAFYMLDEARETARVILPPEEGERNILDFALLRGGDLESDLRGRDFTANAIALDVRQPERLIDPLGGAQDIKDKVLRACSPTSFTDDPARVLRGVRLALELGFRIERQTLQQLTAAVPELGRVSAERLRDELYRIFESGQAHTGLRLLEQCGVLEQLMPELVPMKDFQQGPPHQWDVWEHTLAVLRELDNLLALLVGFFNEDASANLMGGMAVLKLGKFRQHLQQHFAQSLNLSRSRRGLLLLAALYHDAGKPQKAQTDVDGELHFYAHEAASAELLLRRAEALAFSADEIQYLDTAARQHMRVHFLSWEGMPGRRAIYRYFRDSGDVGVDLCLFALADTLATHGPALTLEQWTRELDVCASLLEAWWERAAEVVRPARLLGGDDLRTIFQLPPGPIFGKILSDLEEAQASGEVATRDDALAFVRGWLAEAHGG